MSAPSMTAPNATTPAWEFTPQQSLVIAHLAQRMRVVGVSLIVLAALVALWSVLGSGDLLAVLAAIVLGLTGLWSARAGGALSRAAKTQGADARHMMRALGEMGKLYELQYWIFLAAALLLGVTLLMAITGREWLPTAW